MIQFLVLNYNNYYNRRYKIENSVQDYKDNAANCSLFPLSIGTAPINFNPNDGVETFHIISWANNWSPDYLVVYEYDPKEGTEEIVSRWFIMEWTRTRGEQYRAQLRRDVIADNISTIESSAAYIERGTPVSIEDYSIYNREEFNFNEIKKKETKLKDESDVAWLVGYYKTANAKNGTVNPNKRADIIAKNQASWEYSTPYKKIDSATFKISAFIEGSQTTTSNQYGSDGSLQIVTGIRNAVYSGTKSSDNQLVLDALRNHFEEFRDIMLTYTTGYHLDSPANYNGLIIFFEDSGLYKEIKVTTSSSSVTVTPTKGSQEESDLNDLLSSYIDGWTYPNTLVTATANTTYTINYTTYTYNLTAASFDTLNWSIPATSRTLDDAPYKMFAIPYGSTGVYQYDTTPATKLFDTMDEKRALMIASGIYGTMQTECYDIQLVPYFPAPSHLMGGGRKGIWIGSGQPDDEFKVNYDFSYITDANDDEAGIIIFPKISKFIGVIDSGIQKITNVEDFKIANETEKYRLVSPNYSGMFEFKRTYNNKFISGFKYACTYKPFNPYINVYPYPLSNLYGTDYNDNFGLICGGDFSISLMNDEWKQYQLNNKNFENSFNRELKTLDLEQKQQRILSRASAVAGTIQGTASGFQTGGVGGAIVGAVVSGAAGMADIVMANNRMQDQRNAIVDQHFYQLQNVQARPQSLAKVSSVDINNKLFPILEWYGCSNDEKQIFKQFLKYKGYTINRISQVSNYWKDYIRCHILVSPEIQDDYHMMSEISNELNKGVYVNAI